MCIIDLYYEAMADGCSGVVRVVEYMRGMCFGCEQGVIVCDFEYLSMHYNRSLEGRHNCWDISGTHGRVGRRF